MRHASAGGATHIVVRGAFAEMGGLADIQHHGGVGAGHKVQLIVCRCSCPHRFRSAGSIWSASKGRAQLSARCARPSSIASSRRESWRGVGITGYRVRWGFMVNSHLREVAKLFLVKTFPLNRNCTM